MNRSNLTINLSLTLSEPVQTMFIHVMFYYRYNGIEYKRFPIDIWENICEWRNNYQKQMNLIERTKHYFLEWTLQKVMEYTNLDQPCPYIGEIYVKAVNISIERFVIPQFVPSGRYRVDSWLTDGGRKHIFISGKLYFAISDHRIEQF